MIFVDTSVWISYFRATEPPLVRELNELLDEDNVALAASVRLELLTGAPGRSIRQLSAVLDALPLFFPSKDTFGLAESWIEKGRKAGHVFGAMDLIIGATAAERGGTIWSLDGDFARLERLRFLKRYRPATRH